VSETDIDRAVHDYLDGRLTEEERRAFEARLGREPDLARTVEAYREAGRALRDEPVELPPGFYARARGRFEAGRPARSDWRRFLSWETTGLLAAAVILTALIFPEVWERYRRGPETPAERPAAETGAETEEPKAAPIEREESIGTTGGALEKRRSEPAEARDEKLEIAAEPEARADDDVAGAALDEAIEQELATAPSPAPEKRRALETTKDRAAGRAQRVEEGLARQEKQAAPPHDADADSYRDRGLAAGEFAPAPAAAPPREKKGPAVPRTAALPAGAVDDGELIVIEDAAAWESFRRKLPAGWSPDLSPDFTTERVALVGPAGGLDRCESLRLVETPDRLVIAWPWTPTTRTDGHGGCAVVIPADGRAVALGPDA
jgi:hypothetical protein